ncbi:MAG: Obg family GTPase CgtA, partial [Dysosmobacter sp.]|nr:Obg family GTPase CgtA [Dysosmobacter sp.]
AICEELKRYSPELAERPQIVAANKTDVLEDPALLEALRAHVEGLGCSLVEISAAAHKGTRELVKLAAERLSVLPPIAVYEPDYVPKAPGADASAPLDVRHEDGVWMVEGPWLQRLMANVNFADYESRMWFDRALREAGVFRRLEELGIQDGDTVSMDGFEFEYQK